MPLFVGLLVVTFAIAADLAHEAWSTARAQRDTAERALHEFVRLSATSMSYKAQANMYVGLSTLFAATGSRRGETSAGVPPSPEELVLAGERIRDCRCAPSFRPAYYFRLALDGSELRLAGTGADTASSAERAWLRDTVGAHARAARGVARDAALLVRPLGTRARVVAYTIRQGSDAHVGYAYGFVSDMDAFGDAVFAPLSRDRVQTPQFAAREVSYDSLLTVSVLSDDGRAIYDVNRRLPELRMTMVPRAGHEAYVIGAAPLTLVTLVADTVHLGPQYGGLILAVALSTSAPGELVAGTVPRSRLFVLFGLLVLMAGLVAVAVHQLRREHELARLRANFTTGVSHELRTPLAQILLYGETLILERTRSERERRAAAEVIVREARRLMHLVENALHFARADRPQLHIAPEPVDLATLTREILVTFAPLAWAAPVTLRECIDDHFFVVIDPAAYRQILLNLLDNAVKFGPAGQTITVRLARTTEEPSRVQLTVEDEGPGVSPVDRERIWTPFVRLPVTGRGAPGTGIGLAIVRDLVARHGGRAWVEGAEGAHFIVELPAAARPKETGQDHSAPAARAAL